MKLSSLGHPRNRYASFWPALPVMPSAAFREKCPPVARRPPVAFGAGWFRDRRKQSRAQPLAWSYERRARAPNFVNNVGWHVPGLLADQSQCIARLLPSRRRTLQKYYAGGVARLVASSPRPPTKGSPWALSSSPTMPPNPLAWNCRVLISRKIASLHPAQYNSRLVAVTTAGS
jgi:hypothetical protein